MPSLGAGIEAVRLIEPRVVGTNVVRATSVGVPTYTTPRCFYYDGGQLQRLDAPPVTRLLARLRTSDQFGSAVFA
jgi:hypothetical protein